MPRFPVAFSRRKPSADNIDHAVTGPSFRVMDRSELAGIAKHVDGDPLPKSYATPNTVVLDVASAEDNLFADLKANRGSGSSKTPSTDNSSRHSNASTAPSSADVATQQHHQQNHQQSQRLQDDWKQNTKNGHTEIPVPPIPKASSTGNFLRSAGRTFSFGGSKKPQPVEDRSVTPPSRKGRDRAATASTNSTVTATPPRIEDFSLDIGGDLTRMLGLDKRACTMDTRDDSSGRPALAPRALTGNRLSQPSPVHLDDSWGNHSSNDQLLQSKGSTNENAPPAPRHASSFGSQTDPVAATNIPISSSEPALPHSEIGGLKRSSAIFGRRRSTLEQSVDAEDEDTELLRDSFSAVSKYLSGGNTSTSVSKPAPLSSSRFRRNDDFLGPGYKKVPTIDSHSPVESNIPLEEESLFDNSNSAPSDRFVQRSPAHKSNPPQNKVMTPAQFERYRKDKELEEKKRSIHMAAADDKNSGAEEADNYEEDEDEDESERQKKAAKQRRKQEAHMTVYRQQMMKVTGDSAPGAPARSTMSFSLSTPNLHSLGTGTSPQGGSDESDDDEEVPLAILAAHGFPGKHRPPTRLSAMMSNPNLRAAAAPSYQRPGSVAGDAPASGGGGRLPPFARNLPQDPYGLVNRPVRESLQFSGGNRVPSPQVGHQFPPGGLVGVIASEERSRAMRRGSPAMDSVNRPLLNAVAGPQFDPMAGIAPQTMYPGMGQHPMLSAGDQAQIQMTQQMTQFMQMQMQFMQMMANGGGNGMQQRPASQYSSAGNGMLPMVGGMGTGMGTPDMMRHSFMDNGSTMDLPTQAPEGHMRSMSMVQPSSASWIQPLAPSGGYAPSIRIQGTNGYAPSIAPSERSNIGLPGRYRPVSHVPGMTHSRDLRKSMTTPSVLGQSLGQSLGDGLGNDSGLATPSDGSTPGGTSPPAWDHTRKQTNRSPLNPAITVEGDDEDDEQGWAAMKAKREKKQSMWKSKKMLGSEIGALIS